MTLTKKAKKASLSLPSLIVLPSLNQKNKHKNRTKKVKQQESPTKPSPEAKNECPTKNDSKVELEERRICASIRSPEEPHIKCSLKTRDNEKYCPLHLSQKQITDYVVNHDNIAEQCEVLEENSRTINPILRKNIVVNRPKVSSPDQIVPQNTILHEQKASTIETSHQENEDDLKIKLLILLNEDENYHQIAELIGPVFQDVTLSEDQQDPVTFDPIWEYQNNLRIPSLINKYYLFSYRDSKNKIRCMTIFTINDLIKNNNCVHPMTNETIPNEDINRAKELINLYSTKVGLFKGQDELNFSSEFVLRNRLTRLFKKFHTHSIYLEDSWLLSITDRKKLYKIIKETTNLVRNNLKIINPQLSELNIFQKKESSSSEEIINLQEYIVGEWEKLIEASDSPQNQIPIWIIVSGLSLVIPEVKKKYPDLDLMM